MPELPEVAALAGTLSARTAGLRIARVDVAAISVLKTFAPPVSDLSGAVVLGWTRMGKHLVSDLVTPDGAPLHLVIHLSRAGWVRWRDDLPIARPGLGRGGARGSALALRVALVTDDGEPAGGFDITEAGTQKRLAAYVVAHVTDVPAIADLGPDPMAAEFDSVALHAVLADAGRAQLKGVLRDQRRIAGIGNAYSDEILHSARLSPFAPANGLGEVGEATLLQAIQTTLTCACQAAASTDPTSLKAEKKARMAVHARSGMACPVCGDTVAEVSFADSSLQYCPTCQTKGKRLADRRMSRLLK